MENKSLENIPSMEEVVEWIKFYPQLTQYFIWAPPGHYYSPIPNKQKIIDRSKIIFDEGKPIFSIDLNTEWQLSLLNMLSIFSNEQPFRAKKTKGFRYYFDNDWFPKSDALLLYALLRYINPNRIIEVGSGYSSSVMLDTQEYFLEKSIDFTFIEPNPERLKKLIRKKDSQNIKIVEKPVEEVKIEIFQQLEAGDILFVDSSHITKIDSDVNFLIFDVLPNIQKGVLIHFHDIFHNFEYPLEWILEGRCWNESYLIKAFLQYNSNFEIYFFNDYLGKIYKKEVLTKFPMLLEKNSGSLWIRKIR